MNQENFFSPEIPQNDFATKKEKVLDFLCREAKKEVGLGVYENEGELDENIRNIVIKLNKLPFLYTTQSCGGHLITRESIKARHHDVDEKFLQLPPEGVAIYQPGRIHFETNRSAKSQVFIERLKQLVDSFEGARLFDPTTETEENRQKLPYMLEFGKSGGGIDIQKAKELETQREKFKEEFEKLVDDFLQSKG
jgi:hypothetical protein